MTGLLERWIPMGEVKGLRVPLSPEVKRDNVPVVTRLLFEHT